MRQDAFLNISFEPQLIDQTTWLINRCNLDDSCKQGQKFYEIFEWFGGLELSFRLFQFSNLLQLLKNQLCHVSSVIGRIEHGKYQVPKIDRSCYITLSLKSQKGLGLVSCPQHWAKNQLSCTSLTHIEPECQESLIQGTIHIQHKIWTKTSNICKAKL